VNEIIIFILVCLIMLSNPCESIKKQMEAKIMGKIIELLVGANPVDVPQIVFDYGQFNYPDQFTDYECNVAFSGNHGKVELTTAKAQGLSDDNPLGYGFSIEPDSVTDLMGRFCLKVISKEISAVNKQIKDLDVNDPENDEIFGNVRREVAKLSSYNEIIKTECKTTGNKLKKDLGLRNGFIKVVGNTDKQVKIFIARTEINDDNPGELIMTSENSCDAEFEVIGQIRGLQGAAGAINEAHFAYFHAEDDDLFIEESWFKDGKEKFNEVEYGRLIK